MFFGVLAGANAPVCYRYLIGIQFEILFEFMTLKPSPSRPLICRTVLNVAH
jgi:hypothetical protein